MKKLLVLAAGILQLPIIRRAREMGFYVIAADADPAAPGLPYADKAIVADITLEEAMLAIARQEKIAGVIHPCSEVSMSVMGRINDEMGLHGISRQTALCATNKHLMRTAFERAGAPSPRSYCTEDVGQGYALFSDIGGKALLKPSRSSGSRGIAAIGPGMPFAEFAWLFERSRRESRDASVMIEQFIDGPEFSVEIIIWNRTVNVLQVTDKKTTGEPFFVELGHSQPSCFPSSTVDTVRNAAIQGVAALCLNNCAAHAEVKLEAGKAYLMEIGARLGGDFISTELTRLSTGIDMVAAAIDVAMGIEPNLNPVAEPQGVAIRYFAPPPGVVLAVEGAERLQRPDVYDAGIYVRPGDVVRPLKSSLDRPGHVIVTAPTARQAIVLAEELTTVVKIETG